MPYFGGDLIPLLHLLRCGWGSVLGPRPRSRRLGRVPLSYLGSGSHGGAPMRSTVGTWASVSYFSAFPFIALVGWLGLVPAANYRCAICAPRWHHQDVEVVLASTAALAPVVSPTPPPLLLLIQSILPLYPPLLILELN
uniref:Uncharacterized protein n=1 Tax=Arundo donax TaxID=35708 RepID=A0A0A8YBY6_ARUDO